MKQKLKTFFTENIGWKIISIVLGLIVWALISNAQDPVVTRTVSVPVTYLNENQLLSSEKLCVLSSPENVMINVSVRQSKVSKLRPELFTCTADLIDHNGGDLMTQRVHISVTQQGGADVIIDWSYNKNDPNITVAMDNFIEKEFAVQLLTTDELTEGLILDNTIAFDPETIRVSGPKSRFGNITAVKAVVDLAELSADGGGMFSREVELKLYDANDNVVSNSDGALRLNHDTSVMSCTVSRLQTAKVVIDGVTGIPKDGYRYVSCEAEPETVSLKGLKVNVADLSEIHIPAEAIDISGISGDMTYAVNVADYLPEGVSLAGNNGVVNVTVYIEHIEASQIILTSDMITINGMKAGFSYQIISDAVLKVQGFKEDLDFLNALDLLPAVNVAGLNPGTHTVPVKIVKPAGYYFDNEETLAVQIVVTNEAEETVEPSEPDEPESPSEPAKESEEDTSEETSSEEDTEPQSESESSEESEEEPTSAQ